MDNNFNSYRPDVFTTQEPQSEPSSIFAWIGPVLSTGIFVIMWVVGILILSDIFIPDGISLLVLTLFYIVAIVCGCTLSIIGFSSQKKRHKATWAPILGIIFSILAFLSFLPLGALFLFHNITTESFIIHNVDYPMEEAPEAEEIVLEIDSDGILTCNDNRYKPYPAPVSFDISAPDFNEQFMEWVENSDIPLVSHITVNLTSNTPYRDITIIVETLQNNGFSNYAIETALREP